MLPLRAARMAAGNAAAKPGLRSESITTDRASRPVTRTLFCLPFGCSTFTRAGLAASRLSDGGNVAREAGRRAPATGGAELLQRLWHLAQRGRPERIVEVGRHDGVEQQPVDVRRVRERVRHGKLRPVRRAPERHLARSKRLAYSLDVLGVLARAVEDPLRPDRAAHRRRHEPPPARSGSSPAGRHSAGAPTARCHGCRTRRACTRGTGSGSTRRWPIPAARTRWPSPDPDRLR